MHQIVKITDWYKIPNFLNIQSKGNQSHKEYIIAVPTQVQQNKSSKSKLAAECHGTFSLICQTYCSEKTFHKIPSL